MAVAQETVGGRHGASTLRGRGPLPHPTAVVPRVGPRVRGPRIGCARELEGGRGRRRVRGWGRLGRRAAGGPPPGRRRRVGRRDRPRRPRRRLTRSPGRTRTAATSERWTDRFGGVGGRLVGTLALGTSLNPLNSSMIAVALAQLQTDFRVGVGTSSWLVSAFYIGAAVGQPLMGRLVDQVGARRMFLAGLAVVLLASAATPFVPGFWWLVGLRVVQAFGTSTAYPAALVLIRAATPGRPAPTAGLGAITVANSTSAALGPVLGGFLVSGAGWQAVFLVNVPICLAGLVLARRVLPRQRPTRRRGPPGARRPRPAGGRALQRDDGDAPARRAVVHPHAPRLAAGRRRGRRGGARAPGTCRRVAVPRRPRAGRQPGADLGARPAGRGQLRLLLHVLLAAALAGTRPRLLQRPGGPVHPAGRRARGADRARRRPSGPGPRVARRPASSALRCCCWRPARSSCSATRPRRC